MLVAREFSEDTDCGSDKFGSSCVYSSSLPRRVICPLQSSEDSFHVSSKSAATGDIHEHSERRSWCLQSTLWEILKIATGSACTSREPWSCKPIHSSWLSLYPRVLRSYLFVDVKYTGVHFSVFNSCPWLPLGLSVIEPWLSHKASRGPRWPHP